MKPILFNTEMVRAILDGRKTTTRRVIKPQPEPFGKALAYKGGIYSTSGLIKSAPFQKGDILYVRETFCKLWKLDGNDQIIEGTENYYYAADGYNPTPFNCFPDEDGFHGDRDRPKWHPSLHMPKEAARLFLRVTDVRAERLQGITEEQAVKEGCITFSDKARDGKFDDVAEFDLTAKDAFIEVWNGTLKKDSTCTWANNPWVWVISFEQCKKPEDGK